MPEYLGTFFFVLLAVLGQSAPYAVVGFAIAGLLRAFVSRNWVRNHLGGGQLWAAPKAVFTGLLIPVCSCGVIPIGAGLRASGAGVGAALAFIAAAPALSPVAMLLMYRILGYEYFLCSLAAVFVGASLLGMLGNFIFRHGLAKGGSVAETDEIARDSLTVPQRLGRAMHWGFLELGTEVCVDLFIGLCIAAAISTAIPPEWIQHWLGKQSISSLIYVILLAIPVYTCSIPSIYVAHALALTGAAPGATIAYLIAGPATNLGELNALRGQFGGKATVLYVIALLSMATSAGLAMDLYFYPDYSFIPQKMNSMYITQSCCIPAFLGEGRLTLIGVLQAIPLWHWPFVMALLGLIALGFYRRFISKHMEHRHV